VFTIYCHTNKVNGKRYVGQTKQSMAQRWDVHVYHALKYWKAPRCRVFANAIRKYGADAFEHEVLEVVATQEEANVAEVKWIACMNCRVPHGYNLDAGGGRVPRHPETIEKLRVAGTKHYARVGGLLMAGNALDLAAFHEAVCALSLVEVDVASLGYPSQEVA
jgi:group I intron endonuclease